MATKNQNETILAKLSWAIFKEKLLEEYCNEREMDRLELEFRNLKKGNLSVREYSRIFLEKMNLVGHVAATEKERIKAYMRGYRRT